MALDLFGSKPKAPEGGADAGGHVLEVTDATFLKEVVEESRTRPVVIDFWAPWCGPCRQLTPVLEKTVNAKGGAVRLAKINIDENPQIAGQFRVQSIPAVFVIDQGKAFQGFMGALPESQVKAFIDELASGVPGGAVEDEGGGVDEVLAVAAEALAGGDAASAAQLYAEVLQVEPENVAAIAGLARCYLHMGEIDRAREVAAMAPAESKDVDLAAVRAQLKLADAPPAPAGEDDALLARLAADGDDHQARFDLAGALAARGDLQAASDHLLELFRRDRGWNEDAARKQLLTVFEAAGPTSEVAKAGRRKLSSLMFS